MLSAFVQRAVFGRFRSGGQLRGSTGGRRKKGASERKEGRVRGQERDPGEGFILIDHCLLHLVCRVGCMDFGNLLTFHLQFQSWSPGSMYHTQSVDDKNLFWRLGFPH